MPALNAAPDYALLARVLRDPAQMDRLDPNDFSRLLDAGQPARLLGWIVSQAERRSVPANGPAWLRDRLFSARALVDGYERAVRWEIDRLTRAFFGTGHIWILLKGAAYIAAGLPPGSGRRVADIDVLVPRHDLTAVERLLQEHGWEFPDIDPYDTRYYREWMHELPPMVHRDRKSIVDVHHAILPRTSRLTPASARLIERAETTAGGVAVLCPAHMVLHAAAHLFHDGEIAGAIRDLFDLDQLLRAFGSAPAFWRDFMTEADALDLTRPAFYALRFTERFFATPIPSELLGETKRWAPRSSVTRLMDALVARAIPVERRRQSASAVFALYVRSHWLRMPPLQVVRHLARKSFARR